MMTCNSKKWTETVNEEALSMEPKKLGSRHCPVRHSEALSMFRNRLNDNNLTISKEQGFLSTDTTRYFYLADLGVQSIQDYTFTLGFLNYNNERKAFTPLFGERVFVCTNEMIRSENTTMRTRHTTNVGERLLGYIDASIERFKKFRDERIIEIDKYKEVEFTPEKVNKIVYDMVKIDAIGSTSFLTNMVNEWENPRHEEFKPRTAWSFQNAFTEILKTVRNPIQQVQITDRVNPLIRDTVFS